MCVCQLLSLRSTTTSIQFHLTPSRFAAVQSSREHGDRSPSRANEAVVFGRTGRSILHLQPILSFAGVEQALTPVFPKVLMRDVRHFKSLTLRLAVPANQGPM